LTGVITKFLQVPDSSEPLIVGSGINPNWYSFLNQLTGIANSSLNAFGNLFVCASYVFKFPENETITVLLESNFVWSITEVVTQTRQGTATVKVLIDGNEMDGSPNSCSPAVVVQNHTASNVIGIDSTVKLVFSDVSLDCENLTINLRGQRLS
jgi:hypothetical protein